MLIDARDLDGGETVGTDVCVVGAGAAGITLARELAADGRNVALLESGGFDFDEQTQSLYAGPTDASLPEPEPNYLKTSRLRFLGGTTNHWEGWCRKFDPIDFQSRPWVPMSGWPISREALDPYYERACAHLQIDSLEEDPRSPHMNPDDWLFPAGGPLQTTFFRQQPPLRFGPFYRQALIDSRHIRLYTWANIVNLEANREGRAIERVDVATLTGRRFTVSARAYVLAAGAIEVARLLLVSNGVQQAGLGNQHDMVGRCFMEHPRIEGVGSVAVLRRSGTLRTYTMREVGPQLRLWGGLTASAERQRDRGLLNACFAFQVGDAPQTARHVGAIAGALDRPWADDTAAPQVSFATVMINCEQAPNRRSRVGLAEQKDLFGRPLARLDWRLAEIDRASTRGWLELLALELGRTGIGRAAVNLEPRDPWRDVITSGHHIGTTRMSLDPKDGVVDPTLRVHGLANLYVASSATFPTSGLASPTPTIVALTIRLADHLRQTLG